MAYAEQTLGYCRPADHVHYRGGKKQKIRLSEVVSRVRSALNTEVRRGPDYYNSPMFRSGRWF
jgi:hypothetical protein